MQLRIRPEVRVHRATKGSWFYCVLSDAATRKLLEFRGAGRRARHSKVEVQIGNTSWQTNLILDRNRGWLFVIKAEVRRAEVIEPGQRIAATIEFL